MKAKLRWLILSLGALLAASCTLVTAPQGDFNVSVRSKMSGDPYFAQGASVEYAIDGVRAKEITLTRGMTYTFGVNAPGHPFYLGTSAIGGPGAPGEVTNGVTGSGVQVGTLTFTPDLSTPDLLYYQCEAHQYMGWKINIVN